MADQKCKHHCLAKGDKVPVLVEEALDDVIIVTLNSGTKEFRGILLDCSRRNIPHGVCFDSLSRKPDNLGGMGVNSPTGEGQEIDNIQNMVSASTLRYTYNNDPIKLTEKLVLPQHKTNIRPVRSKAVRDIRLRPRQTLCSKCKNMIHENGKGHSAKALSPKQQKSATNVPKPQLSPSRHLNRQVVTLKWGLRKRKYQQEPDPPPKEKPASKKTTAVKTQSTRLREKSDRQTRRSALENKISQVKDAIPEVRLYKLEDVRKELKSSQESLVDEGKNDEEKGDTTCDEIEHTDEVDSANDKAQSDSSSKTPNLKATPVIKISFGDGAVLKIPPRLPGTDIDEQGESSSDELLGKHSETLVENPNYVPHKKSKKAMKKSRSERLRNRSGDHENRIQGIDEKADKHHRKHKRKHKHKRVNPYESRPLESNTNVIVNDCNANEEKESLKDDNSLEKDVLKVDNKVCDWIEQISNDEDDENSAPVQEETRANRPRLLYTWNNNRGLSRVDASPREIQFPLEEKLPPGETFSPREPFSPQGKISPERISLPADIVSDHFSPVRYYSEQSDQRFTFQDHLQEQIPLMARTPNREPLCSPYEAAQKVSLYPPYNPDPPAMIVGMGPYSPISSASEPIEDPTELQIPENMHFSNTHVGNMNLIDLSSDEPQLDSEIKNVKPLMMKIQTQTVPKCVKDSGRELHVGDIVWGKIQGFPWWPGRVISITVTQKDDGVVIAQIADVTWFGSSTMSHMQCSDLFPFLEDFKLRFNKKKRGPYRLAIKQATVAAQPHFSQSDHHIDLGDLEVDDYKSS